MGAFAPTGLDWVHAMVLKHKLAAFDQVVDHAVEGGQGQIVLHERHVAWAHRYAVGDLGDHIADKAGEFNNLGTLVHHVLL